MKITLFSIGRLKAGAEADLAARYLERLTRSGPPIGLEFSRLIELPESRARTAAQRKAEEAAELFKAQRPGANLILLDERGRNLDSVGFATHLGRLRDEGCRDLLVAIGGPDGFDASARQHADLLLSFGQMTWPHQLVRVLVAEQLYRATTILSGHPYHRS
ncbi:23S rRNA (pseudouridine(1915)-N(3))-methyltransferase RlmH [Pseudohoeflea coraliihabitans]|uniref:Ribosomal RNA large subunit methyltransferase H n=1 Tax=Pseudohoeflea coraliihabitans TaxID=2860393 RepID=A0ABS6WNR0_9HYPH|nr:23S rRNA (pseudouridine(1915)-N(3))-methyltransferase RlmH [Pseudohoeflea sp. DP4N28-3]MBW3096704.1 23S rRNA (pseudouridine(1915)-N(3))-methyltransferase RlmH [Pseudohoeflea sp. DP4N28-3]